MKKPILCLDFDGVIHSYSSGWKGHGICDDDPVPGCESFLYEATKVFNVAVYSSRSSSLSGRRAMRAYMRKHFDLSLTFSPDHDHDWLYEAVSFPWFKPPALITIDDRAVCFDGDFRALDPVALLKFQPWNKRAPAVAGSSAKAPSPAQPSGRNNNISS